MADRVAAKSYLILNDIHVPYQDERAIQIVCDVASDLRPHGIVLNGDILDLPEVSRHNAGSVALLEGKRIAKTFTAGNKLLDQLDRAVGSRCTDRHWINGNHENRWYRWLQSGDNVVFADDETTDLPARLGLARRGYVYHRDYPTAHVKLGKLVITHGQWSGKYPAARHMERYQTSVLVGHTHTVQTYHASTWDGQRVAYCNGYLADPDSEAMAYAPPPRAWQQGFAVAYVAPDGKFWVQLLSIVDGELHYGGKQYPKSLRRAA